MLGNLLIQGATNNLQGETNTMAQYSAAPCPPAPPHFIEEYQHFQCILRSFNSADLLKVLQFEDILT